MAETATGSTIALAAQRPEVCLGSRGGRVRESGVSRSLLISEPTCRPVISSAAGVPVTGTGTGNSDCSRVTHRVSLGKLT